MVVEVRHPSGFLSALEVPVEVLIHGSPPFPVLGREGVFQFYDVLFRAGPDPTRGMFLFSPRDGTGRGRAPSDLAVKSGHRRRAVGG